MLDGSPCLSCIVHRLHRASYTVVVRNEDQNGRATLPKRATIGSGRLIMWEPHGEAQSDIGLITVEGSYRVPLRQLTGHLPSSWIGVVSLGNDEETGMVFDIVDLWISISRARDTPADLGTSTLRWLRTYLISPSKRMLSSQSRSWRLLHQEWQVGRMVTCLRDLLSLLVCQVQSLGRTEAEDSSSIVVT